MQYAQSFSQNKIGVVSREEFNPKFTFKGQAGRQADYKSNWN